MQESYPLGVYLLGEIIDAGRVSPRPVKAGDKTKLDRIVGDAEHDWDRRYQLVKQLQSFRCQLAR